jgi:hypothetical protein
MLYLPVGKNAFGKSWTLVVFHGLVAVVGKMKREIERD